MQLVAVINSFNRRPLLERALESLVRSLSTEAVEYAVVVFEAGSTDGSREWLEQFAQQHPAVRLDVIGTEERSHLSFAEGVNRGCQYALETFPEAEFLFLYETDNWLAGAEPVLAAMQLLRRQPELAATGFTVRLHSGTPCGWGCAFPTLLSFILGLQLATWFGTPRPRMTEHQQDRLDWFTADVVFTSPLLIKASVWRSTGGIDARRFPFSDSDLDWAWKVARAGYQCGVLRTDGVVHDNLGSASGWSSLRVLNFHQARFRLLRKYRGPWVLLAIPVLFLRHLAEFAVLAGMVLAGRRPVLSLKKRSTLLMSVWCGYESLR